MAIAHENLQRLGLLQTLKADVVERLEHHSIDCRFAFDRGLHTMREVVGVLTRAGIRNVLLKGPSLSVSCYPEPALRPMHDIDILVPEQDRLGAVRLLLDRFAYRQEYPEAYYAKGTMTQRLLLPRTKELLPVEVHWDLVNSKALRRSLGLAPGLCLDSAIEDGRLGGGVRVLALPLRFAYTCVHAVYQHQLARLRWLVDGLQMIRCRTAVEEWVLEAQASASPGVRCSVAICLETMKELWPSQSFPASTALRRRRAGILSLLGVRPVGWLLAPETAAGRWHRKLFRIALRYPGIA